MQQCADCRLGYCCISERDGVSQSEEVGQTVADYKCRSSSKVAICKFGRDDKKVEGISVVNEKNKIDPWRSKRRQDHVGCNIVIALNSKTEEGHGGSVHNAQGEAS